MTFTHLSQILYGTPPPQPYATHILPHPIPTPPHATCFSYHPHVRPVPSYNLHQDHIISTCHTSAHTPRAYHPGFQCLQQMKDKHMCPAVTPPAPIRWIQQQQQHALGPIGHEPLQTQPSRVMAWRQMPQGFTFLKAFTLKWWVLGASRSSGCRKRSPEVSQMNTGVPGRRCGQRRKNCQDREKPRQKPQEERGASGSRMVQE